MPTSRPQIRRHATRALTAGLAGLVLATAAACSSPASGSGTPGPSNAGSLSEGLKGKPILIGTMAPAQSSTDSEPWIEQAARIGVAAVNAAGGIGGRPVQLDYCDDHETAQGGSICAQKLLVQDKVTMMVGDEGGEEPSLIPVLSAANTISFGSMGASLQSLSSPRVFIIDPVEAEYWVMPQMLPKTTRKVVYLPEENAISQQAAKANAGYLPKGVTAAKPVTIPSTATSFQSYCLQIKNSGADTVVPVMDPDQVPTLIQTCAQVGVTRVLWAITTFEITPQAVRVLSQLHEKNIVVLGLGGGTIQRRWAADVARYGPQAGGITNTLAEPAINAWLSIKLLPQLAREAGTLNPVKLRAWLDKQKAFTTMGASAPINFAATPISAMPRLKNLSATKAEAGNGTVTVLNPEPYSLHP